LILVMAVPRFKNTSHRNQTRHLPMCVPHGTAFILS
jgi:hypothetical protein